MIPALPPPPPAFPSWMRQLAADLRAAAREAHWDADDGLSDLLTSRAAWWDAQADAEEGVQP